MGYLGSRDYPRLKQLLDEGYVIACFVDYNFGDNFKCRDIACAMGRCYCQRKRYCRNGKTALR